MDLAVAVYDLTRDWPKEELYGLTNQARRASVSIAANIAEGYGRDNRRSYAHFCRIAQGSLKELETHLLLSGRLALTSQEDLKTSLEKCESVGKLLRLLVSRLADND